MLIILVKFVLYSAPDSTIFIVYQILSQSEFSILIARTKFPDSISTLHQ
jgi:hypothetical protein